MPFGEMIDAEMEEMFAREKKRPAPLSPEEELASSAFAKA